MLPSHPAMYAQSPHVVTPATSNPLRYMLNLLGDVEPALHTPHMRHKGIQDKFGEAANQRRSGPRKARTYLSKENMKKLDFLLVELAKTVNLVRAFQNAIDDAKILVPACRNRLNKVRRWLDADIQWLSHHKAKCLEEGTTLICGVACDTVKLATAEMRYICYECSVLMTNNDGKVITGDFSPHAVSEIIRESGRDAASV